MQTMVATFNGFNNGGARCGMQKADINRKNTSPPPPSPPPSPPPPPPPPPPPLPCPFPSVLPITLPLRITVTFPLRNNDQVTWWCNFIVTETNENAAP